jgi:hypothetical protein
MMNMIFMRCVDETHRNIFYCNAKKSRMPCAWVPLRRF